MSNGDELNEIVDGFLIEAQEIFEDLSNALVQFEKNPQDAELINSIFRGFHTLKGTAGFLDFPNIEKSAHVMEDLLNQIRQGKREISSKDIDIIFEGMDILQELLEKIQTDKKDDIDVSEFVTKLRAYLNGNDQPVPEASAKEEKKKSGKSKAKKKNTAKKSDKKSEKIKVEISKDSEELIEPFLDDTRDSLGRLQNIMGDEESDDEEKIKTTLQIIDTIKGSSGFIGFAPLEEITIAFVRYANKLKEENQLTLDKLKEDVLTLVSLVNDIITDFNKEKKVKSDYLQFIESISGEAVPAVTPKTIKQKTEKTKEAKEKSPKVQDDGLEQNKVYEMTEELRDLAEVFFAELEEILSDLNRDFIELEKNPGDGELINKIFRGIHTIKGTSGFIGFDHLVKLTHVMESCLNRARNFELDITPDIMDVLLEGVDGIVELKDKFKAGEPISYPVSEFSQKLDAAIRNKGEETTAAPDESAKKESKTKSTYTPATAQPKGAQKDITKSYLGKFADKTIRVDVERLDGLMDMVGELVLGRNRLTQILSNLQLQMGNSHLLDELAGATASVDFLTTEIQSAVMKTRMVPIGRVFSKFPRLVRDLARDAGKKIELKMSGEETEVDKTVSEDIGDPLVHILRNSVDHGLEPPEERKKARKPEVGVIELNAYHEGNTIVIECKDDGRGIDPKKVQKKAVEKGLLTAAEAEKLTDSESYDLLFKPGFSTAEKVTNISGRGVGMDVVKTNIQKLSGIISINSEVGKGTTIKLQLPLTLAIIQGLVIRVYEEIYIIPLASVLETYRIKREDMFTVKGHYVIRLREEVLPIIQLEEILDIPHEKDDVWNSRYVVVIGLANMRAGIVVDELIGQKEIVIKTLGSYLGSIPGIGGCSILGDGRIRLIVDVADLINLTKDVRRNSNAQLPQK